MVRNTIDGKAPAYKSFNEELKMWRPDNWEDDRLHECMRLTKGGGTYANIYEVYEAGADALLEGLKKGALYRNLVGMQSASDTAVICPQFPNDKGYLIFIPDEEQNEQRNKTT